jgi:vacuole morphology and inheritance protein 14
VRYYACESMYNIAKVAKGEILLYFNQVFDALCKVWFFCSRPRSLSHIYQLAADQELSVKNGAELLDRLVKDIVSESASTYVSVLRPSGDSKEEDSNATAFSLARFIPLLQERITVINPYTRMFLVGWITLLDSIPDLELVTYLPSFLGGLFKFLNDSNPDVHTATQSALERFLSEIKKIARLKKGLGESRKGQRKQARQDDSSSNKSPGSVSPGPGDDRDNSDTDSDTESDNDTSAAGEDDWIPGQDVQVDHAKILDILVTFLRGISGQFESCLLKNPNLRIRARNTNDGLDVDRWSV